MEFLVISSGSKGNCTVIKTKKANVVVDCGITKKKLLMGLSSLNLGLEDIDFLLITHNHSDHYSGAKFFPKEKWMTSNGAIDVELNEKQYFTKFVPFRIKDLEITPLPLTHDAPSTYGFLFEDEGHEKLTYITDTGYVKDKVLSLIKDCTYYIFESNHDTKMLFSSDRSAYLINRIHSDKGHMDNIAAASYLSEVVEEDTEEVVLAHLSDECNTPELAEEAFNKVMTDEKGEAPHLILKCGSDKEMVKGGRL